VADGLCWIDRVVGVLDSLTISTRTCLLKLADGTSLKGYLGTHLDFGHWKALLGLEVVIEGTVIQLSLNAMLTALPAAGISHSTVHDAYASLDFASMALGNSLTTDGDFDHLSPTRIIVERISEEQLKSHDTPR
jgi:hypothetical protein